MRNKILLTLLLTSILLGASTTGTHAQGRQDIDRQRLAQAGMKFLSLSVAPRAAALADAMTATTGTSTALFYNPASMAAMEDDLHIGLAYVDWLSDLSHNAGSIAYKPASGRYGVFGISVHSVDYGEVLSTVRANNEEGFIDVGTINPSGLAVGLGYARAITDRFSVGGQAKYVRQSLGSSFVRYDEGDGPRDAHEEGTVAADFGVLYHTGFRSLNFGVSVRNFSREVTYSQDSFELPLTFRIGFAMDLFDLTSVDGNTHSALLAVDFERPRDYAEQMKAGMEYRFMDILALRAGYVFPTDQQGINLGAGLSYGMGSFQSAVDYAYTNFGVFGAVHRLGVTLGL